VSFDDFHLHAGRLGLFQTGGAELVNGVSPAMQDYPADTGRGDGARWALKHQVPAGLNFASG
jgi:hypothetical protein